MADKMLRLNSLSPELFREDAQADHNQGQKGRAKLVASGRLLMKEHGLRSFNAVGRVLSAAQYTDLNEKFNKQRVLFAAKRACEVSGREAPGSFEDFMREVPRYLNDGTFWRALQGLDEDVVYPILPTTLSDALEPFAHMNDVAFGETKVITIGSNAIPYFSDTSWGATTNVPENRMYNHTYTMNPQPKSAAIGAKFMQVIGNGEDFGRYYSNLSAGLYSKIMAMFTSTLVAASTNTALIPSNLQVTYSSQNFISLANLVSALNGVDVTQLICYGNIVPLSRALPNTVTGSSNTTMDAAIATLVGREYVRTGYIADNFGVKMLPLRDAIVPGTQNSAPATILPNNRLWMMASAGYKPMEIAMNTGMPLTLNYGPDTSSSGNEMAINITTSIDLVVTMASKIGTMTI